VAGPDGVAAAVTAPFGPGGWVRNVAPARPVVPVAPAASRAGVRSRLPKALLRPQTVVGQPLPVEVLTTALAPVTVLPRLPRACGFNPRVQELPVLDAHQMHNGRTIVAVAKLLALPPRAAVIALATAYQESWIRNLAWGDRDSLGLFQQRPSYGWGSPRQILTPAYAAAAFYAPLLQVPGWQRMPLTVAAQSVQGSAFPRRYARWELLAATIVGQLLHVPDRELACTRR
jgi:hypothetical protein